MLTSCFPTTQATLWMSVDSSVLPVGLLWGPCGASGLRGSGGGSGPASLLQGPLQQAQAVASFGCWLGLYQLFAFPYHCSQSSPKTELTISRTALQLEGTYSSCAEGGRPAPTPAPTPTQLE